MTANKQKGVFMVAEDGSLKKIGKLLSEVMELLVKNDFGGAHKKFGEAYELIGNLPSSEMNKHLTRTCGDCWARIEWISRQVDEIEHEGYSESRQKRLSALCDERNTCLFDGADSLKKLLSE